MKALNYTKETIKYIDLPEKNYPEFNVGDTISVFLKVKEGGKERSQEFEGVVLGFKGSGISKTFRIKKISEGGVYVERILPFYSPLITEIKFKSAGKVRRAKLYYLRDRKGKAAEPKKVIKVKTAEERKAIAAKKKATA